MNFKAFETASAVMEHLRSLQSLLQRAQLTLVGQDGSGLQVTEQIDAGLEALEHQL